MSRRSRRTRLEHSRKQVAPPPPPSTKKVKEPEVIYLVRSRSTQ